MLQPPFTASFSLEFDEINLELLTIFNDLKRVNDNSVSGLSEISESKLNKFETWSIFDDVKGHKKANF